MYNVYYAGSYTELIYIHNNHYNLSRLRGRHHTRMANITKYKLRRT